MCNLLGDFDVPANMASTRAPSEVMIPSAAISPAISNGPYDEEAKTPTPNNFYARGSVSSSPKDPFCINSKTPKL